MIKVAEPDFEEQLNEARSRQDPLKYIRACVNGGFLPEDDFLAERGQLESQKLEEIKQSALEIERILNESEERPSQNVIRFIEESKKYGPLTLITYTEERRKLLMGYFTKFSINGIQSIADEKKYTQIRIRDLFRNVVLSYKKGYHPYFEKRDIQRFLNESAAFSISGPSQNPHEKRVITEEHFPEEFEPNKLYTAYDIDSIFQKKLRTASYFLEHNTLQNRV